jgi:hypothetical protein
MEKIEATTKSNTHMGLNEAKATKNILIRMAKAATFGAMDKKAVTGVGAP